MRLATLCLMAAVLSVLGAPAATAASPNGGVAIESVHLDDHPSTTVMVSVPRDIAGESLPRDAFTLLENGRPQDVTVEESRTGELEVLLMMDSTGSMEGDPIAAAKAAAVGFVQQLPDDTRISVMSYETTTAVVSPFSTDKQTHVAAIEGLRASGDTAMYDALSEALTQFSSSGDDVRRAIVLLTDGEDDSSDLSLTAIVQELAASGTTLYPVEFSTEYTDSAALEKMAAATGGRVREADDPSALLRVYDEIAAALLNQYAITYRSQAHGAVPVSVRLAHGDVAGEATTTVEFPPAPVLKIHAVDTSAYPEIALTVSAPEELAGEALEMSNFVLVEGSSEQTITALSHQKGLRYEVRYLSNGHGTTDVGLQIRAGAVNAHATAQADLPTAPSPGLLQSPVALVVGAALCFLGAALLFALLLSGGDGRARRYVERSLGGQRAKRPSAVTGVADWASAVAEKSLSKGDRRNKLNQLLEQAAVNLRPGEFIVMTICVAVTAFVIGNLFGGPITGALLAGVSLLGTRAYLNLKASLRRTKFANQLSDTLQLLAGSLRAGYSVMQAIDAVSREAESPTAEEFRRLVVETRLGRDLTEALQAMRERVGNEDFEWVVQAIGINREVGGDLSEVLDTVGHTIRERNQIRRQVKALSAEGKLSAFVLVSLPFGVAFMIMASNPEYLSVLTERTIGWIMLGVAALMMSIGSFWLMKIVRFKF